MAANFSDKEYHDLQASPYNGGLCTQHLNGNLTAKLDSPETMEFSAKRSD